MQEDRIATIVSAVPGRVRLRVGASLRSPESMQSLADAVSGLEGIRGVQTNPTTGSLLLIYDPESVSIEGLYLAAQAANLTIVLPGVQPSAAPTDPTDPTDRISELAHSVNSSFGRLDRAVSSVSGGKLDAKTLVPLALGAAAVRQLASTGAGLSAIPWYVLLWYSFEMFTKYNLRRRSGPDSPEKVG